MSAPSSQKMSSSGLSSRPGSRWILSQIRLDLRHFLVQVFEPWLKNAEARKQEGLKKPVSLVEACEILGDSKNLQDNAEAKLKVLEDAAASSQKMTSHNEADQKVCAFRERWTVVHECFKEWVARMVRSSFLFLF